MEIQYAQEQKIRYEYIVYWKRQYFLELGSLSCFERQTSQITDHKDKDHIYLVWKRGKHRWNHNAGPRFSKVKAYDKCSPRLVFEGVDFPLPDWYLYFQLNSTVNGELLFDNSNEIHSHEQADMHETIIIK